MKKYSHESEELNALIGKEVSVRLYDGTVYFGVLSLGDCWGGKSGRYQIFDNKKRYTIVFRKTHITHINGKRRRK